MILGQKGAQTILASVPTPPKTNKQTNKQEIAHLELDKIVHQTIRASLYFPPPCLPGNAHIHGPHLSSIHVSFRYSMRELKPQKMLLTLRDTREGGGVLHCIALFISARVFP